MGRKKDTEKQALIAETRAKIGAANAKALAGKPKTPEHAKNISKGKKRQHGA